MSQGDQQSQAVADGFLLQRQAVHEFNNLLMGIIGRSDLLEERLATDPALCHHVTEIRRAAERAGALLRKATFVE